MSTVNIFPGKKPWIYTHTGICTYKYGVRQDCDVCFVQKENKNKKKTYLKMSNNYMYIKE